MGSNVARSLSTGSMVKKDPPWRLKKELPPEKEECDDSSESCDEELVEQFFKSAEKWVTYVGAG